MELKSEKLKLSEDLALAIDQRDQLQQVSLLNSTFLTLFQRLKELRDKTDLRNSNNYYQDNYDSKQELDVIHFIKKSLIKLQKKNVENQILLESLSRINSIVYSNLHKEDPKFFVPKIKDIESTLRGIQILSALILVLYFSYVFLT